MRASVHFHVHALAYACFYTFPHACVDKQNYHVVMKGRVGICINQEKLKQSRRKQKLAHRRERAARKKREREEKEMRKREEERLKKLELELAEEAKVRTIMKSLSVVTEEEGIEKRGTCDEEVEEEGGKEARGRGRKKRKKKEGQPDPDIGNGSNNNNDGDDVPIDSDSGSTMHYTDQTSRAKYGHTKVHNDTSPTRETASDDVSDHANANDSSASVTAQHNEEEKENSNTGCKDEADESTFITQGMSGGWEDTSSSGSSSSVSSSSDSSSDSSSGSASDRDRDRDTGSDSDVDSDRARNGSNAGRNVDGRYNDDGDSEASRADSDSSSEEDGISDHYDDLTQYTQFRRTEKRKKKSKRRGGRVKKHNQKENKVTLAQQVQTLTRQLSVDVKQGIEQQGRRRKR